MNARSYYVTARYDDLTDRRGATRRIKVMTGINKGKRYPYASTRQLARNARKVAGGGV